MTHICSLNKEGGVSHVTNPNKTTSQQYSTKIKENKIYTEHYWETSRNILSSHKQFFLLNTKQNKNVLNKRRYLRGNEETCFIHVPKLVINGYHSFQSSTIYTENLYRFPILFTAILIRRNSRDLQA